eukprot:TRINITY_DN5452_c0_g1_i1.p1 TRINITY_DN5452_c0_g1~~TRINITY_DN5452_c0_g1_i1.p1  ORF type:complete len:664 (+),score=163.02 TRINITY_DN5452_c0_g1_i1:73-1992(+)
MALPDGRPEGGTRESDTDEFGPEGMAGYIKSHMRYILQPFAENVEELHKTVLCLAGNLQDIKARVDTNSSTASQHSAYLSTLQTDFAQSQKTAAQTQDLLETTRMEKEVLEGRMEAAEQLSQRTVAKLDDFIASTSKTIDELQMSLDDTRNRLTKCQETGTATKIELVRTNGSLERIKGDITAMSQVQDAADKHMAGLKVSLENCLAETMKVKEEQDVRNVKIDSFCEEVENKFREGQPRAAQVDKQLADLNASMRAIQDSVGKAVSSRLDAYNNVVDGVHSRMKEVDTNMADHKSQSLRHIEDLVQLVKTSEKKAQDGLQEVARNLDTTAADSSKFARMTREVYSIIKGHGKDEKNTISLLQDDVRFAMRRAGRLEGVMGLAPLSKDDEEEDAHIHFKNGILLTDDQISNFEATFKRYDMDGDNSITTDEVGNVMKSLGHDVPEEAIRYVIKTIDSDHSGEINFDEFCTLMGKMLGPDGTVDVDGYMKLISEEAVREAKQNEAVEIVPILKEEVASHKQLIAEKETQMVQANKRIQALEGYHSELLNEVRILREGLETNQKHWKGLSQGLKDTSRSILAEGEGEMLPKAAKLRNVLPPVGMRPSSARNHYASCQSPGATTATTASARSSPGPASPGWA